jgi:hypothetical protein
MNVSTLGTKPEPKKSALANVKKGKISAPMRVLVYGPEKVGKSTFAAGAPSPIWMGGDAGTEHLDIARLPQPTTWQEALAQLDELAAGGHAYKSLVVDPIGWFEPLVHVDITGDINKPLSMWNGGYGKGFSAAAERWRGFVAALERVRGAGVNIIVVAHAVAVTFEDPQGPAYKRWELALENKPVAGIFKQWADAVLFAEQEAFGKVDKDTKKTKAAGSGARMLHTQWRPAYDAGNRWGLPGELPLAWSSFIEALDGASTREKALRAQIDTDLAAIGDDVVTKKVRAWLDEPRVDVAEVANAVAAKLEAVKEQKGDTAK